MATGTANTNTNCSVKFRQYAASASVRNLVADSPDTKSCARAVQILAAGSFTSAKDASDTLIPNTGGTPGTLGPLAAGTVLTGSLSELISADAAFIAYY